MYSENQADNSQIRKNLKERYPSFIYLSGKSIHKDKEYRCQVINMKGELLHAKSNAFQILDMLTNPEVDFRKSSLRGFDLKVKISISNRIKQCLSDIEYYPSERGKKDWPKDWKRRWKESITELKELKGEI